MNCARIRLLALACGCALLALPGAAGTESAPDTPAAMAAAARRFLDSLDKGQRRTASYDFDDDERFDLRLAPIFLEGLRVSRLDPDQALALRRLLRLALSRGGLAKLDAIMSLEAEVERLDRERGVLGWFQRWLRDPKRYFIALFGEPDAAGLWGFRFDGHHVSLNYTLAGAAPPSSTPLFLGAQPRQVPDGWKRQGLRALGSEEDLARELLLALGPEQRSLATLPFEPDRGLFVGGGRRVRLEGLPAGLPRAAMNDEQKARLDALIEVYVANFAAQIASARRAEIAAAGREVIHFAWAGGADPAEPHYYRIRGPTFLIEYDNTLAGADHVHALWRDFDGDFGLDLLASHYARHHAPAEAR